MRVLHVINSIAPELGGAAAVAVAACEELGRQGADVVLACTDYTPAGQNGHRGGNEEAEFTLREWKAHGGAFAFSATFHKEIRPLVDQAEVVHLHGQHSFPLVSAARSARRLEVPYVVQTHGSFEAGIGEHHLYRKRLFDATLGRAYIEGAAALLTASDKEQATLEWVLPTSAVVQIPFGAAPIGAPLLREGPAVGRLLFVGRIAREKRLDLAIKATAALVSAIPTATLDVVGSARVGDVDRLRRVAVSLGVADRVNFRGFLRGGELASLVDEAELLLLPSDSENFGMVVAEAMLSGLPVLTSPYVGACPHVTLSGGGAVVPQDPSLMAAAAMKLLSDLRGASEKALGYASQHFTWARYGDELRRFYREL